MYACTDLHGFLDSLAGPPLTNDTGLVKLIDNGVTVAFGVPDAWAARNARFDLAWASSHFISINCILVTSNLQRRYRPNWNPTDALMTNRHTRSPRPTWRNCWGLLTYKAKQGRGILWRMTVGMCLIYLVRSSRCCLLSGGLWMCLSDNCISQSV